MKFKVEVYPKQRVIGYLTEKEELALCYEIEYEIRKHCESAGFTTIVEADE